MKKKNFRLLLAAVLTTVMLASAMPAMAQTESVSQNGEDEIMLISADPAAASVKWTSSKLKAAKVDFTKVASASYDKLRISWEPMSGVDGYQIYRATSKSGKYAKIATVKGASSATYTDTGRTCGTRYYYKLRAYKKIGGKTVYSKYSSILSAYAKPAKVKVTDAYAPDASVSAIAVNFKTVRGATDYEAQVNQIKKNGKETGFRSYTYNDEGVKRTFGTYKQRLAMLKKEYPSGYTTMEIKENGQYITKKVTVAELAATMIPPDHAQIELVQDDSIYEFRVRAYRKVNGRKVYGAWSEPYTMKETVNIDEVYRELRQYAIDYAAKNEPRWHYDDSRTETPREANYYSDGEFPGVSIYSKKEDILKLYQSYIASYIRQVVKQGGSEAGFLYISRVAPGDWQDAFNKSERPYTFYKGFMLW